MKKIFKAVLGACLSVGLFCPQVFAGAEDFSKLSRQQMNQFTAAVFLDAQNAMNEKDLNKAAYRLGLDQEADRKTFASEIARRGIQKLPELEFEKDRLVFVMEDKTLKLEIIDLVSQKILLNQKEFRFKPAANLKEALALNLKDLTKQIETNLNSSNALMDFLLPMAHAISTGWAVTLGIALSAFFMSTGKSQSLENGTRNFVGRVGHLGKAVFYEAPSALVNEGAKEAGSTLWGATKNVFTGNESDKH